MSLYTTLLRHFGLGSISQQRSEAIKSFNLVDHCERLEERQLLAANPVIIDRLSGGVNAHTTSGDVIHVKQGVPLAVSAVSVHKHDGTTANGTTLDNGTQLQARYDWNFGDTGTAPEHNTLVGFNAAHIYDQAGTYTLTLTVKEPNGTSASRTVSVVVDANAYITTANKTFYVDAVGGLDSNNGLSATAPKKTFGAAMTLLNNGGANSRLLLKAGANEVYTLSTTFGGQQFNGSNVMIGAYTDANDTHGSRDHQDVSGFIRPVLSMPLPGSSGKYFFSSWDQDGFVVQDLTFQTATDSTNRDLYALGIQLKGSSMAVRNCQFLNIGDAIAGLATNPTGLYTRGIYIADNVQPSRPLGHDLAKAAIWIQGNDWTVVGNNFSGSRTENTVRVDTPDAPTYDYPTWSSDRGLATTEDPHGLGERVLISNNDVANNLKESIAVRANIKDVYVNNNTVRTFPLRVGPYDDGDGIKRTTNVVYDSNHLIGTFINVDRGIDGMIIRNNVIERKTTDRQAVDPAGKGVMNGVLINAAAQPKLGGSQANLDNVEIVNNTGYTDLNGATPNNSDPKLGPISTGGGSFLWLRGVVHNMVLQNNLFVAPTVGSTGGTFLDAVKNEIGASIFSRVSGNVWMDPDNTPNNMGDNVNQSGTSQLDIGAWNTATPRLTNDRADVSQDVTISSTTFQPTGSGADLSPVSGTSQRSSSAWFDYAGVDRPSSGDVTAGAVQRIGAPSAPSGLSATAASSTQINLSWTDNASNETGFKIERSSDGINSWTQVGTTATNVTTFQNTGLTAGTTFYYRVRATNGAGDSANSATASATTTALGTTNLTTTADSYVQDGTSASLNFGAAAQLIVKNDTTNLARQAYLKFDTSSVSGNLTSAKVQLYGSFTNTGVSNIPVAIYSVSDTTWGEGTITWNNKPAAGATALATTTIIDATPRWYEWDISSYVNSERAAGRNVVSLVLVSTQSQSGVPGIGLASKEDATNPARLQVTPNPLPAAPSNLNATTGSATQIDLTWNDNSNNETGFKIERSTDNSTWTAVTTTAAGVTSYSDTGRNAATLYYYRVRATNASGDSANTAVASATTASPSSYRVDVGRTPADYGTLYTDSQSNQWSYDTGVTGGTVLTSAFAVAGTSDPVLYQTRRYGASGSTFSYALPVVNGVYDVKLYFAEANFTTSGQRKFDVTAEGNLILDDFDIVADVGAATADIKTSTVVVNDGQLDLQFDGVVADAVISGISVQPAPAAPSNLSATAASTTQINLAWTDNSTNETGFKVERSTDGTTWTAVTTTAASATSYADTGLTASTTYSYRVRATNANGDSLDAIATGTTRAVQTTGTVANFTGGTGTASVDQYTGTSGSGWANAWGTSTNASTISGTVASSSPLAGGGNYLSTTITGTTGISQQASVGRAYNTAGDVDTGKAHRISFDYRVDSDLSTFTALDDRINLFGDSQLIHGTQSGNTWLAVAYGTNNAGAVAKKWAFSSGDQAGNATTLLDSGVTLTQGTTYHFVIDVDPATKTYSASVSDGQSGSGHVFYSPTLKWRTGNTFGSGTSTYLNFGDRRSADGESTTFSVDNIKVAGAQIVADFSGGNGTASADQYAGTSGGGWATGWTKQTYLDNATISADSVVSTTPMSGSGNYLTTTLTGASTSTHQGTVSRGYSTSGDVDTGSAHRITFDFRLDSNLTNFITVDDRINLFGDIQAYHGTQAGNTWLAAAYGTANDNALAKTWAFADGAATPGWLVNTGIALTPGTVYHFVIDTDPVTQTYKASISDGQSGAGHSFSSGTLNWRSTDTYTSATTSYLNFGTRVDSATDSMTFSLDSVRVSDL